MFEKTPFHVINIAAFDFVRRGRRGPSIWILMPRCGGWNRRCPMIFVRTIGNSFVIRWTWLFLTRLLKVMAKFIEVTVGRFGSHI
jgi:hypothetical protein